MLKGDAVLFDPYLYDFGTQTTQALVGGPGLPASPATSANRVAWIAYDPAPTVMPSGPAFGLGDVYVHDLAAGQTRRVTHTEPSEEAPVVAGDRLFWLVRHPCDVGSATADTGVSVLDLKTGQARQRTGYVEPVALLDAGGALIG
jgi:hypothetical protein